ncbi:hypothetical protein P7C73_g6877, partial [Tremellales sp. Uapishka_1]
MVTHVLSLWPLLGIAPSELGPAVAFVPRLDAHPGMGIEDEVDMAASAEPSRGPDKSGSIDSVVDSGIRPKPRTGEERGEGMLTREGEMSGLSKAFLPVPAVSPCPSLYPCPRLSEAE